MKKVKLEKVEEMKHIMEEGSQVPKEKASSSKTTEVNQQLALPLVYSASCMNCADQMVTARTTG